MEAFSALLTICAGNSPVPGELPAQRAVTRSFDVFFDLRMNKRLSKHSWGWWLETLSHPLWRHRNVTITFTLLHTMACRMCGGQSNELVQNNIIRIGHQWTYWHKINISVYQTRYMKVYGWVNNRDFEHIFMIASKTLLSKYVVIWMRGFLDDKAFVRFSYCLNITMELLQL